MTQLPLSGKALVIIGGTSGIGRSAASAFLQAGASVVVVGRDTESARQTLDELGTSARALVRDATDPKTASEAIDLCLETFQAFHGLYHVAGGSGRSLGDGPLHDITDEGWEATLQLNLSSLFFSNRAAVRQFLRQNSGGSILNIGSVLGSSPAPQHFATHAYTAAKSAVIGFTRSIAAYYAPRSIRVNVLTPGLVETPMARRAATDAAILAYTKTKQPLDGGRIGQPSDLDAAAVYFMSDSSRFATGQVLAVDGGWSVCEGQTLPDPPLS